MTTETRTLWNSLQILQVCSTLQPSAPLTVHQKLGMILEKKSVQKMKLSKNNFNKKCAPKLSSLHEKNQKDSNDS